MLPDRTLHLRVANAELRAKWVAAVGSAVRDIRRVATRPRAMTGGVGMEGRVRSSPAPSEACTDSLLCCHPHRLLTLLLVSWSMLGGCCTMQASAQAGTRGGWKYSEAICACTRLCRYANFNEWPNSEQWSLAVTLVLCTVGLAAHRRHWLTAASSGNMAHACSGFERVDPTGGHTRPSPAHAQGRKPTLYHHKA